MIQSRGHANDGPFGIPLTEMMCGIVPDMTLTEFHTDGLYDNFQAYAYVYAHTGAVMRCNQGSIRRTPMLTRRRSRKHTTAFGGSTGTIPLMKHTVPFMLRFLCEHGKEELTGMHIRDRSMDIDREKGKTNACHVCETVRRAMKRWMRSISFG